VILRDAFFALFSGSVGRGALSVLLFFELFGGGRFAVSVRFHEHREVRFYSRFGRLGAFVSKLNFHLMVASPEPD
jgi:hypothetical protein